MLSSIPTDGRVKKLQMFPDRWLPQVLACCGMQFTAKEWQLRGQSWRAFRRSLSIIITISYRKTIRKRFNRGPASDKKQLRKRATGVSFRKVAPASRWPTRRRDGGATPREKSYRRKRSPMACFITSPLTFEMALVSGISLGQISTQF